MKSIFFCVVLMAQSVWAGSMSDCQKVIENRYGHLPSLKVNPFAQPVEILLTSSTMSLTIDKQVYTTFNDLGLPISFVHNDGPRNNTELMRKMRELVSLAVIQKKSLSINPEAIKGLVANFGHCYVKGSSIVDMLSIEDSDNVPTPVPSPDEESPVRSKNLEDGQAPEGMVLKPDGDRS